MIEYCKKMYHIIIATIVCLFFMGCVTSHKIIYTPQHRISIHPYGFTPDYEEIDQFWSQMLRCAGAGKGEVFPPRISISPTKISNEGKKYIRIRDDGSLLISIYYLKNQRIIVMESLENLGHAMGHHISHALGLYLRDKGIRRHGKESIETKCGDILDRRKSH